MIFTQYLFFVSPDFVNKKRVNFGDNVLAKYGLQLVWTTFIWNKRTPHSIVKWNNEYCGQFHCLQNVPFVPYWFVNDIRSMGHDFSLIVPSVKEPNMLALIVHGQKHTHLCYFLPCCLQPLWEARGESIQKLKGQKNWFGTELVFWVQLIIIPFVADILMVRVYNLKAQSICHKEVMQ